MSVETESFHTHLLTASEAYHADDFQVCREELMDALGSLELDTDAPATDRDTSRYVTVFHQFRDTEALEEGERFVSHGRAVDDRYILSEEQEDFRVVARPIAHIDTGVPMTEDDLGEWCDSYAGKRALEPYFPELEYDDATLPDCEEYLQERDSE